MPLGLRFRVGPVVYTHRTHGRRTLSGFLTFMALIWGAAVVVAVGLGVAALIR